MHKKISLLFLIFGLTVIPLFADGSDFRISLINFPNLNQIPSNSVRRVFQDSEGYIWFGTLDGLCRYDAYNLRVFRNDFNNPQMLTGNEIFAIAEDRQARLWIGTTEGLNILDKSTMKVTQYADSILWYKNITFLLCDAAGNMWIGTDNGLFKHDNSTGKLVSYQNKTPVGYINSIYEDFNGRIWVLLWNRGIYQYRPETGNFLLFPRVGKNNNPYRLLQDKDGNYWLGTWGDGFFSFKPEEKTFTPVDFAGNEPDTHFYSMVQDDVYGYIWTVSEEGIHVLDVSEMRSGKTVRKVDISAYKLLTGTLSEIAKDRNRCLWVGSFSENAFVINLNKPAVKSYLFEQSAQKLNLPLRIVDIEEDGDGVLWLSLDRQSGCLFNPESNTFTLFSDIPALKPFMKALSTTYIKHLDEFWITNHSRQIERFKKTAGKIKHLGNVFLDIHNTGYNVNVNAIAEDSFENTLIGTEYELLIRNKNGRLNPIFNFRSAIIDVELDTRGQVWVITEKNGIYLFQRNNFGNYAFITQYGKNNNIPATDNIRAICAASDSIMWIGTGDGRIITCDVRNGEFADLTTHCALTGENILNILEDKNGHIWISSYNKITRYNPQTQIATIYAKSDGITVNSFLANACFSSLSGKVFFGGNRELCEFESTVIENHAPAEKVLITGIKINNQPVTAGKNGKIVLQNTDKNLIIDFSSLNYIDASKIQYACRLTGVDKDWVYVGNRCFVTYNNLKKGEYVFAVRATSPNGVWSNEITSLTIIKKPAFYDSWQAYLLYALLLAGIGFYSLVKIKNKIRLQNELKIAKIEKQKSEELAQIKLRYFTNISHEFLTPLTIIGCAIDDAETTHKEKITQLETIRYNAERLKRLLQQVLDFRKMESGNMKLKVTMSDISGFIRDVCYNHFVPLMKKKNITLTFSTTSNVLPACFDADKIDKIIFNLLSNAYKYTPENGNVKVVLEKQDDKRLRISICDTGTGIPATDLERIFTRFYNNTLKKVSETNGIGLSLTKELVELHHGTINVESREKHGTKFFIEIPIDRNSYSNTELGISEETIKKRNLEVLTDPFEKIGADTEKRKLLFVEDDIELLALIEKLLSRKYQVTTSVNGKEALAQIREKNVAFDVIISDVMMPEMDGLQLCNILKNDLETSHIPIILLTAKNSSEDRIDCYNAGADAYISKPFELNVLEARINNFLLQKKKKQEAFKTNAEINISQLESNRLDEEFLKKAVAIIEKHLSDTGFDINILADKMFVSRPTLYRKFTQLTGLSPSGFIRNVRLKHAYVMLQDKFISIVEIAESVGFSDPKHFSKCFKKEFGITPADRRKER
jgi:signal transduction histidine kinase/ligand-binding sensor domain-containing protein/DNA-binding response OmpR family regulator